MKTLSLFAIAVSSFLVAFSSGAQSTYGDAGAYAQVAGSYAICKAKPTDGSVHPDCNTALDNSFGLNIRGGYRFNRWVSVEGQFEWIHGYTEKNPFSDAPNARAQGIAYSANARVYALEGRIQPYGLAGFGGLSSWLTNVDCAAVGLRPGCTDTYNSVIGRFGGGVDGYLTKHIALTAEFTYVVASEASAYNSWWGSVTDSNIDPNYMSFSWGLMYRF